MAGRINPYSLQVAGQVEYFKRSFYVGLKKLVFCLPQDSQQFITAW